MDTNECILTALVDAHFHLWHILGGLNSEFVCTPNQKESLEHFDECFREYALHLCPECCSTEEYTSSISP